MMTYRSRNNMYFNFAPVNFSGGVNCSFTFTPQKLHSENRQTGENFSAVYSAWAKSSLLKTEFSVYAFVT